MLANSCWGSVHVCTTMKISTHDASSSENICNTSKNYHIKFHIILYSRLAVLCLQMHFGGLCTYARLLKSSCMMQVGRKTFAVLQSIIIFNFTSFRPVDQQHLACKFILGVCARMHGYGNDHAQCKQIETSTRLANAFWGSVHVCTNMKIIMHDANSWENIRSTSKQYHTKFHIIPSTRLAVLCLQMHFGGLCTYARL